MGRLKELLAKGSGKYFDWKNKRDNERPARELKSKQRALVKQQALESRINKIKTRNRLLKVQNQATSLRKQRLRATLGFFSGVKTARATRRVRVRKAPRRAYKYVTRAISHPEQTAGKMWWEK